uniref:RING-type domain-containing protein n=1 Tax=Pyramimonas orientalis virus TaxID=455367 RepID=A0A7M3UPA5_POV01|nr:hypothetical protein HWQ62_00451 [Pyramimonas orientalis virus]
MVVEILLPVTETYEGEIPLECGCGIWSRSIHLPRPDQLLPTCKNKITRLVRLNNGNRVLCCGRHAHTDHRDEYGAYVYVDTLKRQSANSKVFVPLPPPAPKKPRVARKDKKFTLPFVNINCDSECSICMEAVLPSNGGHLKCNHSFHNSCITSWFIKNKNTCPYCRKVCDTKSFQS